jgi:hypothetical protein
VDRLRTRRDRERKRDYELASLRRANPPGTDVRQTIPNSANLKVRP